MTYYNTLVAHKLKTISEIKRTNSLIDSHKRDGKDFSVYLEQLAILKTELERLNAQILAFQLSRDNQLSISAIDPSLEDSPIRLITPEQNDITDNNLDDLNSSSAVRLPE